jgi:hypothetical protein
VSPSLTRRCCKPVGVPASEQPDTFGAPYRHDWESVRAILSRCAFPRCRCVRPSVALPKPRMVGASISSTPDGPTKDSHHQAQWSDTEVGPQSDHGLHASTSRHVQRIRHGDRPHDGAQGCIARRNRIWNPDDSVLHQSWWKESEYGTAHRARESQAHSSAASRRAESGNKEALSQRGSHLASDRITCPHTSRSPESPAGSLR